MKLKVLVDNNTFIDEYYLGEPAVSYYIEDEELIIVRGKAGYTIDKEELKNIAFSELYTRCQSMISSLYSSGVTGKILDSNSLVDLLYMAYNRDEAEVFGLDKALQAGYDELYSTAPEVIEKKIMALDKEIEEKAISKAEDTVALVRTAKERKLEERKRRMDDIVDEMAKMIIQENEPYLGKEVTQDAVKEITASTLEKNEAKKKKKLQRRR